MTSKEIEKWLSDYKDLIYLKSDGSILELEREELIKMDNIVRDALEDYFGREEIL